MTEERFSIRPPDQPYEEVSHPDHYQLPGGIEVLDIVEGMSFNLGNAVKYLLRAGKKPGVPMETDLKKAVFYIQREIDRQREDA
jgi:hypothetical protein